MQVPIGFGRSVERRCPNWLRDWVEIWRMVACWKWWTVVFRLWTWNTFLLFDTFSLDRWSSRVMPSLHLTSLFCLKAIHRPMAWLYVDELSKTLAPSRFIPHFHHFVGQVDVTLACFWELACCTVLRDWDYSQKTTVSIRNVGLMWMSVTAMSFQSSWRCRWGMKSAFCTPFCCFVAWLIPLLRKFSYNFLERQPFSQAFARRESVKLFDQEKRNRKASRFWTEKQRVEKIYKSNMGPCCHGGPTYW